jgi:UDP-N-acetylglucosamine/UDP-N-acetylgalactosamine diphosphorylase
MENRGVTQISYTQVDNPLAFAVDPLFLGLHDEAEAGMSSKAVAKAHAGEKLGNLCVVDGRIQVVEYSDMPASLTEQTDEQGNLRYRAGSIALHAIDRRFVERLGQAPLPWHRAEKKVPYCDRERGETVAPETPNAVKLEMFVFDALPKSERSIVLETPREEEFAPIKNATGDDSPRTSKDLQVERAARWLRAHGCDVPRADDGRAAATVEIRPRTALFRDDLDAASLPPPPEPGGTRLV